MRVKPTKDEATIALRDHVRERALAARERVGGKVDDEALLRLLEDREVVRFETRIVFDDEPLEPGEFAYVAPVSESPRDGFTLYVHPHFRERRDVLPHLIAYHLVRVNYGDITTYEEAELFGATLLDMEVDDYYELLCQLVDGLPVQNLARCSS